MRRGTAGRQFGDERRSEVGREAKMPLQSGRTQAVRMQQAVRTQAVRTCGAVLVKQLAGLPEHRVRVQRGLALLGPQGLAVSQRAGQVIIPRSCPLLSGLGHTVLGRRAGLPRCLRGAVGAIALVVLPVITAPVLFVICNE